MFKKIYIEKYYEGREALQLVHWSATHDIPVVRTDKKFFEEETLRENLFIGSVPYLEGVLNATITPDYFPEWILDQTDYRRDHFKMIHSWDEIYNRYPVFVKPHLYKYFVSFKAYSQKQIEDKGVQPPFFVASVQEGPFIYEWRHYIAEGKIMASEWYQGLDDREREPFMFPWKIPSNYSGAVDVGMPYYGPHATVLIEAHHPFSCGWYGDYPNFDKFLNWEWIGWQLMVNNYAKFTTE